jgi:hypothetical protein
MGNYYFLSPKGDIFGMGVLFFDSCKISIFGMGKFYLWKAFQMALREIYYLEELWPGNPR